MDQEDGTHINDMFDEDGVEIVAQKGQHVHQHVPILQKWNSMVKLKQNASIALKYWVQLARMI